MNKDFGSLVCGLLVAIVVFGGPGCSAAGSSSTGGSSGSGGDDGQGVPTIGCMSTMDGVTYCRELEPGTPCAAIPEEGTLADPPEPMLMQDGCPGGPVESCTYSDGTTVLLYRSPTETVRSSLCTGGSEDASADCSDLCTVGRLLTCADRESLHAKPLEITETTDLGCRALYGEAGEITMRPSIDCSSLEICWHGPESVCEPMEIDGAAFTVEVYDDLTCR